jgi:hypothetical protein
MSSKPKTGVNTRKSFHGRVTTKSRDEKSSWTLCSYGAVQTTRLSRDLRRGHRNTLRMSFVISRIGR